MPKISQLESATDVTANDLVQIVDVEDNGMAPSGTNKKTTAGFLANQLVPLISSNTIQGDKLVNSSITSSKIGTITATGTTTGRSLPDRFSDIINIKDFGAIGNNTANDTSSIQAALDYARLNNGGIVFVPTGTYRTNATLLIGSNTTLQGEGYGSQIKALNGAGQKQHLIQNHNTTSGNINIEIKGLYLDANGSGSTLTFTGDNAGFSTVLLVRCENSVVENCWVTGGKRTGTFPNVSRWGEGVELNLGNKNTVRACKCFLNNYDGIKTRTEKQVTIEGNHCWDNGRSGIQLAYSALNSGFNYDGSDTVKNDGTLFFVCNDNVIEHSTGIPSAVAPTTAGIYFHPASYGIASGNVINGVRNGIGSWGATENNLITGNNINIRGSAANPQNSCFAFSNQNGGAAKNQVVGNYGIGSSGDNLSYITDQGIGHVYKNNRFVLEGGTGTWNIGFAGSDCVYVQNNQSSASTSNTGSNNTIKLDDSEPVSSLVSTLTDKPIIEWDLLTSPVAKVTLNGNRVLDAPTNIIDGAEYKLLVGQDSVGSRSLTFPSVVKWANDVVPTLTSTANRSDLFIFSAYDGFMLGSSVLNYPQPIDNPSVSLFDNFDSGSVSGPPAGWTLRWNQTGATWRQDASGFFRLTKTSSGRSAASFDQTEDFGDVEVLAKLRTDTVGSSASFSRIVVRGRGTAGSETGIAFGIGASNVGWTLTRYVGGVVQTPEITISDTFNASTWYWVRLRVIGTNIRIKTWLDGASEPANWSYDGTPAGITPVDAGWVGVFGFSSGNMDWDYISCNGGGGTAS